MKKQEIDGIQYLRGLAAVSVVVDHTAGMVGFDKYFSREILNGFLSNGARGVDLFFLISGFIICMIALKGPELSPNTTPTAFAERRFTRIVPLMWLAILSYAALRLAGRGTFFAGSYLRALTLFPAGDVQPNQIWTLRHEAIFYALFAFSFLVGRRKTWILLFWAAAPFVYAALSLPQWPTNLFGQFTRIVAHPVNIEFFTGFVIGLFWHKKSNQFSFSVPISPVIIFACAMIAFMAISYAFRLSFDSIFATTISASISAPILFAGIHVRCHRTWIDRLGNLLGDASYAIYLFHPHFVSAILGVWSKVAYHTPITIVIGGTILLATFAAVLVHLYIERPLLKASRNMMDRLVTYRPHTKI
jgi:exopolysaccharide production protein ExoZ